MVQTSILSGGFQCKRSVCALFPPSLFLHFCPEMPVSHHYIAESLHLRVSVAADSWKEPSRKTPKRRIVGLI